MKIIFVTLTLIVAISAQGAPSADYLPPVEAGGDLIPDSGPGPIGPPSPDYIPPVGNPDEPIPGTAVGEDGYRYKTVRKIRYRLRH